MVIRFAIAASGAAITTVAAALLLIGQAGKGWLALSVGLGTLIFAVLPGSVIAHRSATGAIIAVFIAVFVAARATDFVINGTDASVLLVSGAELLILATSLVLVRDHLCGLGRLAASLAQPSLDGGYARILDLDEGARVIEVELARSRRRNAPVHFIELRGCRSVELTSVSATPYLSPRSVRYLENLYVHGRLGKLLADHARRSDVIVKDRQGRYVIVSPDTDAVGAMTMAQRVVDAARTELAISVGVGIAAFPEDGETFRDLRIVATQRASAGGIEPATLPASFPIAGSSARQAATP